MFIYPNGDKYKGAFKNGKREGFGLFELNDEENIQESGRMTKSMVRVNINFLMVTYEGIFVDGMMQGQGSYSFLYGNLYIGEFKDGKRQGLGVFTYANGNKYGEFKRICMDKEHSLIQWR